MKNRLAALAAMFALLPAPALAELPPPVRAILEAAVATGDEGKVATVVELARQTNPDEIAAIDAMHEAFLADRRRAEQQSNAAADARIREAGLLDSWSGKGEIGANRSTGTNSSTGFTGGLELDRKGINVTHALKARADYQRTNGLTTRKRLFVAYEPQYRIKDGLFAYGLGQFEDDHFQGFNARYSASAGVGYAIVDARAVQLKAKLGPAYRRTEFIDGASVDRFAALFGLDFDWEITDRVKLTQDSNVVSETGGTANLIVDSNNFTLNLLSGLQVKVSDKVSTRLTYQLDYDSSPPGSTGTTSTLSRFSLVYGF